MRGVSRSRVIQLGQETKWRERGVVERGKREREREGEGEGRETERETEREGDREGDRKGDRVGDREGDRETERREGGRERESGKEGEREGGRKGGREGGRKGCSPKQNSRNLHPAAPLPGFLLEAGANPHEGLEAQSVPTTLKRKTSTRGAPSPESQLVSTSESSKLPRVWARLTFWKLAVADVSSRSSRVRRTDEMPAGRPSVWIGGRMRRQARHAGRRAGQQAARPANLQAGQWAGTRRRVAPAAGPSLFVPQGKPRQ